MIINIEVSTSTASWSLLLGPLQTLPSVAFFPRFGQCPIQIVRGVTVHAFISIDLRD